MTHCFFLAVPGALSAVFLLKEVTGLEPTVSLIFELRNPDVGFTSLLTSLLTSRTELPVE
jgi:hypothetical protein